MHHSNGNTISAWARMLARLVAGEATAAELAQAGGIGRTAVYRYLAVLESHGLAEQSKDGREAAVWRWIVAKENP